MYYIFKPNTKEIEEVSSLQMSAKSFYNKFNFYFFKFSNKYVLNQTKKPVVYYHKDRNLNLIWREFNIELRKYKIRKLKKMKF